MKLIEVMAGDWDLTEHADTYRERVMELIQAKAEGMEPVIEEEAAPRPEMADLLAALRRSVEEAKDRAEPAKKVPAQPRFRIAAVRPGRWAGAAARSPGRERSPR